MCRRSDWRGLRLVVCTYCSEDDQFTGCAYSTDSFDGLAVLGFCAAVTFAVTVLLCLPTALRVSAAEPVSALKGDAARSRNRFTYSQIAVQVAFCFLVLFVGTLFITSFERLSRQPTGFFPDRILTLETLTAKPVQAVFWE
jgi:hypothetical protein